MAAILGARRSSKALMVLAQILFVVGLLAAWQILTTNGVLNAFVVGTPMKIGVNIWQWLQDGSLVAHTAATVIVTLVGYATALVAGVAVGTVAGTFPSVGRIISPFITFWQGFPRLVFYPFFAVALGYTIASRMIHVAFVIIFIIIVSTAAGVADVDPDIRHNARILGANRWQVIRDTRLPAAVLWVGTSARITFGFAIQAAIVAEFTGAGSGLGYLMVVGQNSFDVNVVWAATVAAIVVAAVVDRGLLFVQNYFSRWQSDQR